MNSLMDRSTTVNSAVKNGALNNLKWLYGQNGFTIYIDNFYSALERGSLDLLKWLFVNGCTIPSRFTAIAENCSIETLEWLKEKGLPIFECSSLYDGSYAMACSKRLSD